MRPLVPAGGGARGHPQGGSRQGPRVDKDVAGVRATRQTRQTQSVCPGGEVPENLEPSKDQHLPDIRNTDQRTKICGTKIPRTKIPKIPENRVNICTSGTTNIHFHESIFSSSH